MVFQSCMVSHSIYICNMHLKIAIMQFYAYCYMITKINKFNGIPLQISSTLHDAHRLSMAHTTAHYLKAVLLSEGLLWLSFIFTNFHKCSKCHLEKVKALYSSLWSFQKVVRSSFNTAGLLISAHLPWFTVKKLQFVANILTAFRK